jgi:anti-anti-sigma factor
MALAAAGHGSVSLLKVGGRHRGGSRGGAQGFTTAAELRETLATQLGTGARLLTVDASGLRFPDSASLRVLILAARALKGRHGRLVFARPQPLVARLLEITGADRLLEVQE